MKYRTFRMLFLGVFSAVVLLGGITIYKVVEERDQERRLAAVKLLHEAQQERALEARVAAKAAAAARTAAPDGGVAVAPAAMAAVPRKADADLAPLRPLDKLLLQHLAKGFAGDRPKDVFPREPYKVNVARKGSEFRIKVDLDRDGHWDEKWTASSKGGQPEVKRQVAPADDEHYTAAYHLDGEAWRKK